MSIFLILTTSGWNYLVLLAQVAPPTLLVPRCNSLLFRPYLLNYDTFPHAFLHQLGLSQDMISNIRNAQLENDINDPHILHQLRNPSTKLSLNLMRQLRCLSSFSVPWLLTIRNQHMTKSAVYSISGIQTALSIHTGS